MNKIQLRQILIGRRNAIDGKPQKNAEIGNLLLAHLKKYDGIFIYVSMGSEVSTHTVIDKLMQDGKSVCVPYTDSQKNMVMAVPQYPINYSQISDYGNVKSSGIYCGQAVVSVVPMVGYNAGLNRIGYGAGCYDRFFSEHNNLYKIGLAYSEQQCEFTPDDTDVAMDIIITEKGIIRRNL